MQNIWDQNRILSATALLATPTDVYLTGTMHWWIIVGAFLAIPATTCLYLPVFHELQVISANQYLEMRFNHIIRRSASAIFLINQVSSRFMSIRNS